MKAILDQRHPLYSTNQPLWQFYLDHYEGGATYPFATNPIAYGLGSQKVSPSTGPGSATSYGAQRYLWQYPLERSDKYVHRLSRAAYINIVQPVVDFYASTVGKPENILCNEDPNFAALDDNVDLQGQSFQQFMARARASAAVHGHTFLFIDSTKGKEGERLLTERDYQEQGIRPYWYEISPQNLVNWRLDDKGVPVEVLFRVEIEPAGSLLEKGTQDCSWQYRYWSRSEWRIFEQKPGDKDYVLKESGKHNLNRVPIVPLYHKRKQAFLGTSLLKDSAKLGQLCTNWVSALDEGFEVQMFAIPVWKSKKSPTDAAVGTAVVLHLNPDDNESFEYVTPDTGPFETGWDAFYRLVQLANKHMGIAPKAITNDKVETQSGTSKEWDFFEAEKILASMALNEQEAVKTAYEISGLWMGKTYSGSIQYATKYDLASATDDINDLVLLQSAGVPKTARQELMRRVMFKKLPSLDDNKREMINSEIDGLGVFVDPATAIALADAKAKAAVDAKPRTPSAKPLP